MSPPNQPLPGSSQQYHAELAATDTPRTAPPALTQLPEVKPAAHRAASGQMAHLAAQSDRAVLQASVRPSAAEAASAPPAATALPSAPLAAPSNAPIDQAKIEKTAGALRSKIKEGKYDFAGPHGEDAEVDNNDAFNALIAAFQETAREQAAYGPPDSFDEWAEAVIQYLAAEAASYAGFQLRAVMGTSEMDSETARETVRYGALHPEHTGHSGKPGIGTYEQWCAQKHPAEFAAWKKGKEAEQAQREQTEQQRQATTAAQEKLTTAQQPLLAQLQTERGKIPPEVAQFPGVAGELTEIQTTIQGAQTSEALQAVSLRIAGIAAFVATVKKLHDRASAAASKMRALPTDVVPPQVQANVDSIVSAIEKAHSGTVTTEGSETLASLEAKIPEAEAAYNQVETIAILADDPDVKESAKREEVLTAFREGKADIAKTRADLEALQNAAQGDVAKIDAEEAPTLDMWAEKLKDAEEEGGLAHRLLAMAERIIVALAGIGLLRNKIVGEWISNKRLAEVHNDPKAKIALKAEQEFRHFGVRRKLATTLGGHKVSQILEEYKKDPTGITSDETEQRRVSQLMRQLEKNGGAKDDRTLYEFLGNNEAWAKASKATNFYKASAVAQAPAAPTVVATAPAVAAATAPAPAAAPATAPAQQTGAQTQPLNS